MSELDKLLKELFSRVKTLETSPQTGLSTSAKAQDSSTCSTSSSSYGDPTSGTSGPSVQIEAPSSGQVLVMIQAFMTPGSASAIASVDVPESGISALDADAAIGASIGLVHSTVLIQGLAEGTNTIRMRYRSTGGSSSFSFRTLTVIPM